MAITGKFHKEDIIKGGVKSDKVWSQLSILEPNEKSFGEFESKNLNSMKDISNLVQMKVDETSTQTLKSLNTIQDSFGFGISRLFAYLHTTQNQLLRDVRLSRKLTTTSNLALSHLIGRNTTELLNASYVIRDYIHEKIENLPKEIQGSMAQDHIEIINAIYQVQDRVNEEVQTNTRSLSANNEQRHIEAMNNAYLVQDQIVEETQKYSKEICEIIDCAHIESTNTAYLIQDEITKEVQTIQKNLCHTDENIKGLKEISENIGKGIDVVHTQSMNTAYIVQDGIIEELHSNKRAICEKMESVQIESSNTSYLIQDRIIESLGDTSKNIIDAMDSVQTQAMNTAYLVHDEIVDGLQKTSKNIRETIHSVQTQAINTAYLIRDEIFESLQNSSKHVCDTIEDVHIQSTNTAYLVQDRIIDGLEDTSKNICRGIETAHVESMNTIYLVQDRLVEETEVAHKTISANHHEHLNKIYLVQDSIVEAIQGNSAGTRKIVEQNALEITNMSFLIQDGILEDFRTRLDAVNTSLSTKVHNKTYELLYGMWLIGSGIMENIQSYQGSTNSMIDQKFLELTNTCFLVQDQLVESLDKIPSSTATLVQCNCDNPDSIVMKALDNLQDVFNDGMNELEDRVGEAKTSTNRAIIEADVNQRKELARILLKEIETYEIQVIDLKYYIVIKVMEWEREKRRGRSHAMETTRNQSTQTEIEMESLLDENGCRFPMSHVEVSGNVDLAKRYIEAADREGIKLLSDDDHSDWFEEGPRATPEKGGDVDSVLDEEDPSATLPEKGDDVDSVSDEENLSATAPEIRDDEESMLDEANPSDTASEIRDDERPASPVEDPLSTPEKRGMSPDPTIKPNKRLRRDESLVPDVPNDTVDESSKAFKIIDIGYRYVKGKNGNKKSQPKLLKNVSVDDIPLSTQQRIIWKDARATKHRIDNISANENPEVAGRCWRSDDKKLESREWDRKGECLNCVEAKKNGEEDVVCFYFIKTSEICVFK